MPPTSSPTPDSSSAGLVSPMERQVEPEVPSKLSEQLHQGNGGAFPKPVIIGQTRSEGVVSREVPMSSMTELPSTAAAPGPPPRSREAVSVVPPTAFESAPIRNVEGIPASATLPGRPQEAVEVAGNPGSEALKAPAGILPTVPAPVAETRSTAPSRPAQLVEGSEPASSRTATTERVLPTSSATSAARSVAAPFELEAQPWRTSSFPSAKVEAGPSPAMPVIRPAGAQIAEWLDVVETAAAHSASRADPAPIHVKIGRVEVRGAPPKTPTPPVAPILRAAEGFAAYARIRNYRNWPP
jgi:hypothetical protein